MAYDVSNPEGDLARKAHGNTVLDSEAPVSIARLERLRAQILRGTYHVPSEELAESLLRSLREKKQRLN